MILGRSKAGAMGVRVVDIQIKEALPANAGNVAMGAEVSHFSIVVVVLGCDLFVIQFDTFRGDVSQGEWVADAFAGKELSFYGNENLFGERRTRAGGYEFPVGIVY